jgi:hypothetical protein
LTLHVDKRAPGVAGVDGRIGLDEVCVLATHSPKIASGGRNYAGSHRLRKPKRTAQRYHPFALLESVRIAQSGKGEVLRVDLYDSEIGLTVLTHHLRFEFTSVLKLYSYLIGVSRNVIVG